MSDTSGIEIAVIGMAGRFPGAKNLDQFWQNLCAGVESIKFFTDEELLAKGVAAETLDDPNYVKAEAILDDIEMFDASFFDFTPREASLIDPQHRLFSNMRGRRWRMPATLPSVASARVSLRVRASIHTCSAIFTRTAR